MSTNPLAKLRGAYDDTELAMHVGPLLAMTQAEVKEYLAEREAPLIAELAALHEQPLSRTEDRARRREISEKRLHIGRIWSLWKDLHRPDDAGENLVLG